MNTYPTAEFEASYKTNEPIYLALAIASIFVVTAPVFLLYDYLVQRRQHKLMSTAKCTNAIVSELFPKEVQQRMMEAAKEQAEQETEKSRMTNFLDNQDDACCPKGNGGKPIADLFPSATIMVSNYFEKIDFLPYTLI